MKYVAIDIETTGLDREHHMVLEVAAIIDDLKAEPRPVGQLPTYHCLVQHSTLVGDPVALAMHSGLLAQITGRQPLPTGAIVLPADHVMPSFADFLGANGIDRMEVTAAGKNIAGFDLPFLRGLPSFERSVVFHHRSLDVGSLLVEADDEVIPSLQQCLRRVGISRQVDHTAVGDARAVVEIVRRAVPRLLRKATVIMTNDFPAAVSFVMDETEARRCALAVADQYGWNQNDNKGPIVHLHTHEVPVWTRSRDY